LKGRWATAVTAVAVFLFLAPFPWSVVGRFGIAWKMAAHIGLWGMAAWAWQACQCIRPWVGMLLLSMLVMGVEFLQQYTGRSPGWMEAVLGLIAVAGMTLARGLRFPCWKSAMLLGVLCSVPFGWMGGRLFQEWKAFPIVVDGEAHWNRYGWEVNGGYLLSAPSGGSMRFQRKEDMPTAYPGLFKQPVRKDWRGSRELRLQLFWPGEKEALFGVRLDDSSSNPPYADRVQTEVGVTSGWNQIQIPMAVFSRTPGGRSFRLDHVRRFGVFVVSSEAFHYFDLRTVEMNGNEETQ
jgi:hypothetical protein